MHGIASGCKCFFKKQKLCILEQPFCYIQINTCTSKTLNIKFTLTNFGFWSWATSFDIQCLLFRYEQSLSHTTVWFKICLTDGSLSNLDFKRHSNKNALLVNYTVKSNYKTVKFTDCFIVIFSWVLQVWFDVPQYGFTNKLQLTFCVYCVIPENIHTSPTEGKTPHPSGNSN